MAFVVAGGIVLGVSAPTTASAHTRFLSPVPRSDADGLKPPTYPPPCGNVARTNNPTAYETGATIKVKWEETIAHQGCYQIAFSSDDTNFTVLAQIDDPAGMTGTPLQTDIKLPAGVTCEKCTLQLRQLMLGAPCTGDTANPADPPASTYYSCADLCVGPDCVDAGAPTDGGTDASVDAGSSGGTSGGPVTTPTDGGGKTVSGDDDSSGSPNLRSGAGDSGCSIGLGATSGVSLVVMGGLLGLALGRRRRGGRRAG